MLNWLRRPIPRPRSTREMVRVLRAAAHFSDGDAERGEYDQAADALDRVIESAERHSDAPTRDAFAYALGRAELDLSDKLIELIEVSKETHMIVQGVHSAQVEQGAAAGELWAAFQSFGESVSGRLTSVEDRAGALETTVAEHSQSRDQSLQDRRLLRQDMDASKQHRAQIQARLDSELPDIKQRLADLGDAVQRIESLLEPTGDRHEAGG
jgi:hypothetical protein